MKKYKVLGIIPARGGSKSVPRKNLFPLCGKPLIEYTFDAAKKSKYLSRIILTTDDLTIAAFGNKCKIEVPFIRPKRLSRDNTPMLPVIRHAVNFLAQKERYIPDLIVILQPTSPLRRSEHIDDAVKLLIKEKADSVVSVVEVPHQYNPISVMKIRYGRLLPFLKGEGTRMLRKQDKPKVFARNGAAVYAIRYNTLMKKNSLFGKSTLPLVMDINESIDIDTKEDIEIAQMLMKMRYGKAKKNR